jgi:hypothetical protein
MVLNQALYAGLVIICHSLDYTCAVIQSIWWSI